MDLNTMHWLVLCLSFFQLPAFLKLHPVSNLKLAFDPYDATISTIHTALLSGDTSCRDVISLFLAQIETYNPDLNAIIGLNPKALETADALDVIISQLRNKREYFSEPVLHQEKIISNITFAALNLPPLFCIPTLIKDNIDTSMMPTTGGALAFSSLRPIHNAPVVNRLLNAGAIVLAKTNLQELALEGISVSSLGGQTVNPYDLGRTPGGSSGGNGAGLAAGFGVLAVGTDTMNSVRSPASACGIVGMRPGFGVMQTAGVMPASWSQDVVGPMARTVRDVAVLFKVMNGEWETGHSLELDPVPQAGLALQGVRLGVIETLFNRSAGADSDPEVSAVNQVIETALRALHAAGATLIPITNPTYNSTDIRENMDLQVYEFREAMDDYLSSHRLNSPSIPPSLSAYYSDGTPFLLLPSQYCQAGLSLNLSTQNSSYAARKHKISILRSSLRSTFSTYSLDALIYPHQTNLAVPLSSPSQYGRNGILAAVTGFPAIALPSGYSRRCPRAREGVPVGVELLGLEGEDSKLLGIAERVEKTVNVDKRVPPVLNKRATKRRQRYSRVPKLMPNKKTIPAAYPIGVR